jgi:hypothetical protein
LVVAPLIGCSSTPSEAAAPSDLDATAPDDAAGSQSADSAPSNADDGDDGIADAGARDGDAGDTNACEWGGAPGVCLTTTACAALADHTSYAGECPGPATIECCIKTPSTADNPPTPAGYALMAQADVTADMTTWAVAILNDPTDYPMFSTTTKTFGTQLVLARVEWHPPDFQNSVIHRGVTLYEPTD